MNDTSLRAGAQSSWLPAVLAVLVGFAVLLVLVVPAGALSVGAVGCCGAIAAALALTVPGQRRAKLIALALLGALTVVTVVGALAT